MRNSEFKRLDPKLKAEIHPTMNGDLRADDVRANSKDKLWWLADGNAWVATPRNRSCGFGSPFAAAQK